MKSNYISVKLFILLLLYAEANNYDKDEIIQASGVNKDILRNKNGRVEIHQFLAAVSILADLSGYELTGLDLVEKVGNIYRKNDILLTIMSNCRSLEDAVIKLIQYHDISSDYIKLNLNRQGGYAELILETQIRNRIGPDRILSEAAMAACAGMFRDLTMGKVRFNQVYFIYPEPEDLNKYKDFFGCPLVFRSDENKIVISNEDLKLPIALSDQELLAVLEVYAGKILSKKGNDSGVSESTRDMISEMILQGKDYSLSNIAKKMAKSERTLQKKLKEENSSYRALLRQAKEIIAVKNLQNTDTPLTDIAFLLGFSEQSAFNHSFKKWTGLSPGQFRDSHIAT